MITLWYLVFQRLNSNHRLSAVQEDALAGGADRFKRRGKKPLSRQLHSPATTSFSDARQRLPLALCHRVLRHSAAHTHQCLEISKPLGFKLALLDGTTCRLRPLGDVAQEFAPHRCGNAKRPAYWCLARAVGVMCWATGVVIDCAMGSLKNSEQALSAQLLAAQSWKGWLLAGDRNFGVYFVARAMAGAGAEALLRLTQARARSLARAAGKKLRPGLDVAVDWIPTSHNQCPKDLTRTAVPGRLLAVRLCRPGFRAFTLYLFTTLVEAHQYPSQDLARIYGLRWQVELCLRYIKVQMDLGLLECHSAAMARKEWLAGLIAYNLIRWTMGAAAALAKVPVASVSFNRTREYLLGWWWRHAHRRPTRQAWRTLLERVAAALLPKRRRKRPSQPRAIRPFQKDVAKLYGPRALACKLLKKTKTKS